MSGLTTPSTSPQFNLITPPQTSTIYSPPTTNFNQTPTTFPQTSTNQFTVTQLTPPVSPFNGLIPPTPNTRPMNGPNMTMNGSNIRPMNGPNMTTNGSNMRPMNGLINPMNGSNMITNGSITRPMNGLNMTTNGSNMTMNGLSTPTPTPMTYQMNGSNMTMNGLSTPSPMTYQMNGLSTPSPATYQMNGLSTPSPMTYQMNGLSTPSPMTTNGSNMTMNGLSTPSPMTYQMNGLTTPSPMTYQMNGLTTPKPTMHPINGKNRSMTINKNQYSAIPHKVQARTVKSVSLDQAEQLIYENDSLIICDTESLPISLILPKHVCDDTVYVIKLTPESKNLVAVQTRDEKVLVVLQPSETLTNIPRPKKTIQMLTSEYAVLKYQNKRWKLSVK